MIYIIVEHNGCQFRIEKKMPNVEFETVETLGGENRGGFGSTGKD